MANITVSTDIDTFLQSADNAVARGSLGVIDYPYTTDFQSGVEQTRNLTSITDLDGYKQNQNFTSIYVGSNVTSIGDQAFFVCQNLTSATIGNSVTSIGSMAFLVNVALTSVTIPNSVTSIGSMGFYQCSSLTSVIIPDSVTSLGANAFGFCSSLTSIIFPDNITSIPDSICNSSGLTSVTIPNSVTSIGTQAFMFCSSLATINCLATTAPTIGSNAFFFVAASDIHVPVGATYPATYGGLTVVFDL